MSFADLVREELCELPTKHPCCRHALMAGLLLCAGEDESRQIAVRYRQEVVATFASAMIRQQYGKAPDSSMTGKCGHRYYDLFFTSPACRKLLFRFCEPEADIERILSFSCDGCRSAFLRGAFLACGTVNDPHKSFHLEFSLQNGAVADMLSRFLSGCGYEPRRICRNGAVGIYYKGSALVEDLVALMGAQHVIFEIINSRIERDIRNNENRATNCVAKNIEKSIAAATSQMEAIGALMETGKFERLPEALRTTAMVRYRNPDSTLDELVALHEPPISKSGLNHRLKKLLEEAELLLGKGTE